MKKSVLFFLLTISTFIFFSCSDDDQSNTSDNLQNVEIVLTEGKASNLKLVPVDENLTYYDEDKLEQENVNQVSFTLPAYTHHFYLTIQGNQQKIQGYVKINGQKRDFNTLSWYYQGTYYLYDFK